MNTTVALLRSALTPHFADAPTAIRRMVEAELLPQGRPGRDGCGSAQLDARRAALVLLACVSGVSPTAAPAAAVALSDYRRRGRSGGRLLDWLAREIERAAADPDHRLPQLEVALGDSVRSLDPSATGRRWRATAGPVDAASLLSELLFLAPQRGARHDDRGRPLVMWLVISPEPLRAVADSFASPVASAPAADLPGAA